MKRSEIASIRRAAHNIEEELQSLKQAFKRSLLGSLGHDMGICGWDQVRDSTEDMGDSGARSLVLEWSAVGEGMSMIHT